MDTVTTHGAVVPITHTRNEFEINNILRRLFVHLIFAENLYCGLDLLTTIRSFKIYSHKTCLLNNRVLEKDLCFQNKMYTIF